MRKLSELVDLTNPAWPEIEGWISASQNVVEVLQRVKDQAEQLLVELQVTTRSSLGAVAYETGGILIDDGWVRVLGTGSVRMKGNLRSWNGMGGARAVSPMRGLLLVAHDAVGGVFALDGGALGGGRGEAYYFAPDTLRWESLNRGYTDLLQFFFTTNLEEFYGGIRWEGWREEAVRLSPDEGFSIYPPLWSKERKDAPPSRRAVPMAELVGLNFEVASQLFRSDR